MPILASLLLAAQSAPPPVVGTNSPPPPVMVVNTAPPPALYFPGDSPVSPPAVVEVRISGEGAPLWQGVLRVGPAASYSENRSESRATPCPGVPGYDQSLRTSLNLNLSHYPRTNGPGQFGITFSWSRPSDARNCQEGGTRTVQLQQTVELAPGGEAVLRGDGGLTLQLRRR